MSPGRSSQFKWYKITQWKGHVTNITIIISLVRVPSVLSERDVYVSGNVLRDPPEQARETKTGTADILFRRLWYI